MATLRWLLLLAAAGILPSCGSTQHSWVWITVHNDGDVAADVAVDVHTWDDHHHFSVAPHESTTFGIEVGGWDRLTVEVWRSTDHHEIFDESWDHEELKRLHWSISITVSP